MSTTGFFSASRSKIVLYSCLKWLCVYQAMKQFFYGLGSVKLLTASGSWLDRVSEVGLTSPEELF